MRDVNELLRCKSGNDVFVSCSGCLCQNRINQFVPWLECLLPLQLSSSSICWILSFPSVKVVHSDVKPANMLVSFDRSGKHRDSYKQRYWKDAQLKLADFGVSRIIPTTSSNGGTVSSTDSGTTGTVSLAALTAMEGIAGTESYMSPELLAIVRAVQSGKFETDPVVDAETLLHNDAFGCGCVIGFLCSRGLHPYQSVVFRKIASVSESVSVNE